LVGLRLVVSIEVFEFSLLGSYCIFEATSLFSSDAMETDQLMYFSSSCVLPEERSYRSSALYALRASADVKACEYRRSIECNEMKKMSNTRKIVYQDVV
jgi:hypothetical protein